VYARGKPITWFEDGHVAACRYPDAKALEALSRAGVTLVINLHERAHTSERLAQYPMREVHLPVRDFTPPTADQLESGVTAIIAELDAGGRVAVHCGGGLGRTGTLMACYLVARGASAEDAIARIRSARPGSIETTEQVAAVHAYASAHASI
jgi:atypical dual specificity phosphatase